MKTIFITSFHSIISKNILSTDILKMLANEEHLRIVIFVPEHKKDLFKQYYAYPNVIFEGVDVTALAKGKKNTFGLTLARLLVDSHYLWYKKRERFKDSKNIVKYLGELVITFLFARSSFVHSLFRLYDAHLLATPFKHFFELYKPDIAFVTDVFDKADAAFLATARICGVRTIGMVRSWDNCYSKGLLRVIPDEVLVNNSEIKKELVFLHDVKEKVITIVGMPQFDTFKHSVPELWESFSKKMGLHIDRRLILISPLGAPLSQVDWQILKILQDAVISKRLPQDIQFLVRLHPGRTLPLGTFVEDERFILDTPGVGDGKDVEFMPNDVTHLFNSLYHSRIVVWVATTLCIDAAVLNRPNIVADFDGWEHPAYIDSVRRYHNEDHMKKMLLLGGTSITHSGEELINSVQRYLDNPSLDQEGRDSVIKEQVYFTDGKSAERIANILLRSLGAVEKKA